MSAADATHLRAVQDRHHRATARLREALGTTTVDDDGNEQHGLAWWYPQVKRWPSVRSVGSSGGGRGGSSAAPINLEALDFLGSKYWVGDDSQDRASHAALLDDENYRLGFEPTLLELEKSVRRALGHSAPLRQPRAGGPLEPTPAVTAALVYLLEFAPEIAADEFLAELVREESIRLLARARGMLHGSLWTTGRGPCTECHQVDSVINDDERAVCLNPFCRAPDGGRTCWGKAVTGEWVRIEEPEVRKRGRLDDQQLQKLAGADLSDTG